MAISVGMGGMVIIIRSLLFGMGDNIPAGVATRRGNLRFNAFGKTKGKRCSVASPLPTKTFFCGSPDIWHPTSATLRATASIGAQ